MPRLFNFTPDIISKEIYQQLEFVNIKSVEHFLSLSTKDLLTKIKTTEKVKKKIEKKLKIFFPIITGID